MSLLKDIPELRRDGGNLSAVLQAVSEAIQTFRGYRGNPLDKAMTERDAIAKGVLLPSGAFAGVSGSSYSADTTPPPTPTGLSVTAGIGNIYVSCDSPTYTGGHGHDRTVVFGAKWGDGSEPTFSSAVELFSFQGVTGNYSSDPATRWCIWIKWRTVDGELSISPAGGANGVQATTGQDMRLLMDALTTASQNPGTSSASKMVLRTDMFYIGPDYRYNQTSTPAGMVAGDRWYNPSTQASQRYDGSSWTAFNPVTPFSVQSVPVTINGVVIPAGVYMDSAYITNLSAMTARLGSAWIDSAMIGSLDAAKLTAGDGTIGGNLKSSTFVSGVGGSGWLMQPSGTVEFNDAIVRGTIYATSGSFTGTITATNGSFTGTATIKDNAGNVLLSSGSSLNSSNFYGNALGRLGGVSVSTVIAQLQGISSDNVLSTGEKPAVVKEYGILLAEQAGIDDQATAYQITTEKTAYDNALSSLTSYLAGLTGWNTIPGGDVVIVGTTFSEKFSSVYAARQDLLNKMASFATNPGNPITPSNVSTYIASAAIDSAKIGSVDADTITTGYLNAARINAGTINTGMIIGASCTEFNLVTRSSGNGDESYTVYMAHDGFLWVQSLVNWYQTGVSWTYDIFLYINGAGNSLNAWGTDSPPQNASIWGGAYLSAGYHTVTVGATISTANGAHQRFLSIQKSYR